MGRLLTLMEASDMLRLSSRKVRQLVVANKLRTARIVAGKLLFTAESLAEFVAEAEGRPSPAAAPRPSLATVGTSAPVV